MSTIKRGSTATGHLVWDQPQPITPQDLNPKPPPMPAKATIESFQTPVVLGQPAQVVAKVLQGTPTSFRWQYLVGTWKTAGEVPGTKLTYEYQFPAAGTYPIRLQTLVDGIVTDQTGTPRVIKVAPKPPDPPQPPHDLNKA